MFLEKILGVNLGPWIKLILAGVSFGRQPGLDERERERALLEREINCEAVSLEFVTCKGCNLVKSLYTFIVW